MFCTRRCKEGVLIELSVVPNSSENKILKDNDRIKVRVRAPPVHGKANREVIRLFSRFFDDCEIVSGLKSRKKTVLIRNYDILEVEEVLHKKI